MLTMLADGDAAEVGLCGNEGMNRLPLLLGVDTEFVEAMIQEFLALMLCVHRPGVTLAARMFQPAGIVEYGKGRIRFIDREDLKAAACECYGAVRERSELVLGTARG